MNYFVKYCHHALISSTLAFIGLTFAFTTIALAAETTPQIAETPSLSAQNDPGPLYARVLTDHVGTYTDTTYFDLGITPARTLGAGYLWVTLHEPDPITINNKAWYRINEDEYVEAIYLAPFVPSIFKGITMTEQPTQPFAWLIYYVRPSITPGIATTATDWLRRYDFVTISATTQITESRWYQVGPDAWVHENNVGLVDVVPRPDGVEPNEKWLDINLYEQTLAVYEGDKMVYATLVSSGLPRWETPEGLYRLWAKIKQGKMSGGMVGDDYYFLEDVPWTMYFKDTYGLHGAYWHDGFGFPQSHGCVNMTLADSQWLFNWVTPQTGRYNWTQPTEDDRGTWVQVRAGDWRDQMVITQSAQTR